MKLFPIFIGIMLTGCQTIPANTTNQTTIIPQPKQSDTLIVCRSRYTEEEFIYYRSYSKIEQLGPSFYNIKIIKIIDNSGQYRIINELEMLNYDCIESSN